jgi:hypothetical protein
VPFRINLTKAFIVMAAGFLKIAIEQATVKSAGAFNDGSGI